MYAMPTIVTIASLCLLNGPNYENMDYVLTMLYHTTSSTDFICLPHMPFLSFEAEDPMRDLAPFAAFAQKNNSYLALSMTENEGSETYWTAILFDRNGKIVGKYRKAHALIDDLHNGERISLGNDLPVFDTDFGKIGLTIGTDIYLPEVYEVLRMKGARIITWQHYPERIRDHSAWEPMLMARCVDSHAYMVTSMYADERTYLTQRHSSRIAGSPWGRSMIINRAGTPVADTGYDDGVAMAVVNIDKEKKDMGLEDPRRENIFIVSHNGDRKALRPVAEPYKKPTLPQYMKRTCRLAVGYFDPMDMWVAGKVPQTMLDVIDEAAPLKPDLLLLSEQACPASDETTDKVMDLVAQKAREMNCYIAIGGIGNYGEQSACHVWDRNGEIIYHQPIYWPRGFENIEVFDTDFGRVGSHTCGDLYTPLFDRVLALKGAEIIIDPSQMWGGSGRLNETMLRARAADNSVWVACAHWNTSDPSLRSVIVDPYGQLVAASQYQHNGVIAYDISLDDKRVCYADITEEQRAPGTDGGGASDSNAIPKGSSGWQDMVFASRRPELYGIVPTVNDIIMQYRAEKNPYIFTEEQKAQYWRRDRGPAK